jgi:hypothetical protein
MYASTPRLAQYVISSSDRYPVSAVRTFAGRHSSP